MSAAHSGGCLCRSVTYAFDPPVKWSIYCHCQSCRLNCAAPFTAFVGVDDGQWRWTGAVPGDFQSSPGVHRFFCQTCGSPVAYRPSEGGEVHFYTAALDDPSAFPPRLHVFHGEKLPWVELGDNLPVRT